MVIKLYYLTLRVMVSYPHDDPYLKDTIPLPRNAGFSTLLIHGGKI
jgi:hypothetical protein